MSQSSWDDGTPVWDSGTTFWDFIPSAVISLLRTWKALKENRFFTAIP